MKYDNVADAEIEYINIKGNMGGMKNQVNWVDIS